MAEFVFDVNAASGAGNTAANWRNVTAGTTGALPTSADEVAIGPRGNSGTGITASSATSGATSITLTGTSISLVKNAIIKITGTTGLYMLRDARSGNGAVSIYPALRANVSASSVVTYYNGVDQYIHDIPSATWGSDAAIGASDTNGGGGIMVGTEWYFSRATSTAFLFNANWFFADGAKFNCGTDADPIPLAVTHNWSMNSASPTAGKYCMLFGVSTANYRWGTTATALLSIRGYARTRATRITASISGGATSCVVADATGWQVGDAIIFSATSNTGQSGSSNHTGVEEKTIGTITPGSGTTATITWTGGLVQAHSDQGYVYNITSNVTMTPSTTSRRSAMVINIDAASTTANVAYIRHFSSRYGGANTVSGQTNYSSTINIAENGVASGTRHFQLLDCNLFDLNSESLRFYSNARSNSLIARCTFGTQASVFVSNGLVSIYNGNGGSYFEDCHFYRGNWLRFGFGVADAGNTFTRCVFGGAGSNVSGIQATGTGTTFTDCFFGSCQYIISLSQQATSYFTNCYFGVTHPTVGGGTGYVATNIAEASSPAYPANALFTNCVFQATPAVTTRDRLGLSMSLSSVQFTNLNADVTQQLRIGYTGNITRDNATYRRSLSSIKFSPLIANTAHGFTYTLPGASSGNTYKVKGSLRFDSTYGTATPPSITLSGQGSTPASFTAPAVADTWHDFELSVTVSSTGDLSLAVTGTSAATTGNYWLDGVVLAPYVTVARQYGCAWDNATFCTADTLITVSTEATVAAYTGISVNHGTQTVTITSNHTLAEVYDYLHYDLTLAANLGYADYISGTLAALTLGYNLVIDGCTMTGTGGTLTIATGKTVSMLNSASLSALQILSATSGDTGLLTITGLNSSTSVAIYNDSGTQVDYVASASSTYSLFLTLPNTGTWKYVIHRPGYEAQIGTFNANSLTTVAAVFTLITNADGSTAYTGSSSSVLAVSFTGTTQGNLDIGNGTVTPQQAFDEAEVALSTSAGMDWLAAGKTRISQFNSAGGDYLFLSTGWRLRRASAGDVNATLNAFAVSADGTPIDGTNGSVAYLTSDSPTAIATAVWAAVLETGFSASREVRTIAAAVAGKTSGGPSGFTARNLIDTADQITGTADSNGNRTSATYGS